METRLIPIQGCGSLFTMGDLVWLSVSLFGVGLSKGPLPTQHPTKTRVRARELHVNLPRSRADSVVYQQELFYAHYA